MFGAGTRNWRFTWSSGHGAALSLDRRRWLAADDALNIHAFISRATVQRATSKPSRCNCRQTLRTP
jgi:hypothetical protein